MKSHGFLATILAAAFATLFVGVFVAIVHAEEAVDPEIRIQKLEIIGGGRTEEILLDDLLPGGTLDFEVEGHLVHVTRVEESLDFDVQSPPGVAGKVVVKAEGLDDKALVLVAEGDGENVERKKVIVLGSADEALEAAEGAHKVIVKKCTVGTDGEMSENEEVLIDVEEEMEAGDGERRIMVKAIRKGDGSSSETEKKVIVLDGSGRIIIDGEELDIPAIIEEVKVKIDSEEMKNKIEQALIELEVSGEVEDSAEIRAEITAALDELDGLKHLEGLEGIKVITMSGDACCEGAAECESHELSKCLEKHGGLVRMKAHSDSVAYRCPEDGTVARIPKDQASKDKYKCPVCRKKMELVNDDEVPHAIAIKVRTESEDSKLE